MKNASEPVRFSALVLAGDRQANDPVAAMSGLGCKALTKVQGIPMLHRVLAALRASDRIAEITLMGPSRQALENDLRMHTLLGRREVFALEPASTPSASALRGLLHVKARPVFVTTADHALLRPEIIDYFLDRSRESGCDVSVALTPLETVTTMFPGHRRTAIKLKGGPYCGSNMFAFMTPQSEKLAAFWRSVEEQRKSPRKVISSALGLSATLKYLMGTLSLERALEQVSSMVGLKIGAVLMPFAEAAVDIDSMSDHALVERFLLERER